MSLSAWLCKRSPISFKGVFLARNRVGFTFLLGTNNLAFLASSSVTKQCIITLTNGVNVVGFLTGAVGK